MAISRLTTWPYPLLYYNRSPRWIRTIRSSAHRVFWELLRRQLVLTKAIFKIGAPWRNWTPIIPVKSGLHNHSVNDAYKISDCLSSFEGDWIWTVYELNIKSTVYLLVCWKQSLSVPWRNRTSRQPPTNFLTRDLQSPSGNIALLTTPTFYHRYLMLSIYIIFRSRWNFSFPRYIYAQHFNWSWLNCCPKPYF